MRCHNKQTSAADWLWLVMLLISILACATTGADTQALSGTEIMQQATSRQQIYPHVYEEQTLILMDKTGNKDVRSTRRYTRIDNDKSIRLLLVFDSPQEVRGVALLVINEVAKGKPLVSGIYLPAFGDRLFSSTKSGYSDKFLGSDFSVYDLQPENIEDFSYTRLEDIQVEEIPYYQVESKPANQQVLKKTGYFKRVHTVSKDRKLIISTDYYDSYNRLYKTLSRHDFVKYDQTTWWPNMLLMENHLDKHQTLVKVNNRVFSIDYVPLKMFSKNWLFAHNHMASTIRHLFDNTLSAPPDLNDPNDTNDPLEPKTQPDFKPNLEAGD